MEANSSGVRESFGPVGCIVSAVLFWWFLGEPIWHSKLRYSIQYEVPYSSVTKMKKPHNCDFLRAPLGDKNCEYEPQVSAVKTATSTEGKPIVSFDEGQNWSPNDSSPPVKPSLTISWKKKIDEDEE
jgi:hypothetical protein